MKYSVIFFLMLITFVKKANAQSIDSIQFNIYENYESNVPPIGIDLNKLPIPTLFIINNKKLRVKKYSDLNLENREVEQIQVIQDEKHLKDLNFAKYRSVVIIKCKN